MIGWLEIETHDEATGERGSARWENIVTAAGAEYYLQRFASQTPTNFVNGAGAFDGVLELGTAGNVPNSASTRANMTTKVAGSQRACDGGFPKTDDDDPLNVLFGTAMPDSASSPAIEQTVTYKVSYPAGTFTATAVDRAILTNPSPGASEPVVAYTTGTAFTVNSSTAVVVRWNHRIQAVV